MFFGLSLLAEDPDTSPLVSPVPVPYVMTGARS